MSLAAMIEEYKSSSENLRRSIEGDDFSQVRVNDIVVANNFENIMNTDPKDDSEKRILIDFLLNEIIPDYEKTTLKQRIRNKILSLVSVESMKNETSGLS